MAAPVGIWIAQKVAGAIATTAVKSLFSNLKANYDNVQAYLVLKELLFAYHKARPSECVEGKVTRLCPQGAAVIVNNPKAGGTDILHIYSIVANDGTRLHIQFFDITQKIFIWEFSENWEPKEQGNGRELNPVDALDEIRTATGIGLIKKGVKGTSPHVRDG